MADKQVACMTHQELNELFRATLEERRSLLTELKALDRISAIQRLMHEPLVQRLYWYRTLPGKYSKAEFKQLCAGASDDEIVDAQIVLAKARRATSDAAMRSYGYKGHERMDWDANVNRMLAESGECPATIVTHSYDRDMMSLR